MSWDIPSQHAIPNAPPVPRAPVLPIPASPEIRRIIRDLESQVPFRPGTRRLPGNIRRRRSLEDIFIDLPPSPPPEERERAEGEE